jgi:ABC-type multidrug transport system fused ATPase/permease subunit
VFFSLDAIAVSLAPFFYKWFTERVVDQNFDGIYWLVAGFIALKALAVSFFVLRRYLIDKNIYRAERDLRIDVMDHVQHLDFEYHTNKSSGSLISKIKRGSGGFYDVVYQPIRIVYILLQFVFMYVILAFVDVQLAIIAFVVTIIHAVTTYFLINYSFSIRKIMMQHEDNVTGTMVDTITNYETVKFFAREVHEKELLTREFQPWSREHWRYMKSFHLMHSVTDFITTVSIGAVIIFGLLGVHAGRLGVGDFVLALSYALLTFSQIDFIIKRVREVVKSYVDIKDYTGLLNLSPTIVDTPHATQLAVTQGAINFEDVTFSYPKRSDVLQSFTLAIRPNESIALVGRSGGGKSTITKLLMRLYDIDTGAIMIDGQDIAAVTQKSLRQAMSYVPQEPILFNRTIGYNIGYAKEDATNTEIIDAAKRAHLHHFIETLPEGYQTIVGERGVKLSGGQKQRLAIARAILKDAPILVFDEATSQLDSESEQYIQKALWEMTKNKTTIIIAHRLSTIMRADRVIVVEDGRIVEEGSHDALMKKEGGVYQYLWELQSGGELLEN